MDRIDDLLDAFLESGVMPPEATPEERTELQEMAAAASTLRAARDGIDREASAAAPTARARFERSLIAARRAEADSRARDAAPRKHRRRTFARIPHVAWLAIFGVVLVGVLAFAGGRLFVTQVETVEALEPGDFAQIEGVVTRVEGEGDARVIRVASPLGPIVVETTGLTSVVDDEAASELGAIRPGTPIAVGGVVSAERRIAAQTLAIVAGLRDVPVRSAVERFRGSDVGLVGTVVAFGVSEDGERGRAVVRVESGRQYLVLTEPGSVVRLLEHGRLLGARVRVAAGAETDAFAVELLDGSTPAPIPDASGTVPPGRPDEPGVAEPGLVVVQGLVLSGEPGMVTVLTRRGRVQVTLSAETRVLTGDSGIVRERALQGEPLVGRAVAIRGGLDGATGNVVANVVVIGGVSERVAPRRR